MFLKKIDLKQKIALVASADKELDKAICIDLTVFNIYVMTIIKETLLSINGNKAAQ